MIETKLRKALVDSCLELERLQINRGTSGNLSVRLDDSMLITPSQCIRCREVKGKAVDLLSLNLDDLVYTAG